MFVGRNFVIGKMLNKKKTFEIKKDQENINKNEFELKNS
jgi:hypothetical protein